MNKFLTFFIMIVFLYAVSCGDIDGEESSGYEIAVIVRNIDDKSFNQSTWEGVKDYAEHYGISYKYYRVPDKNVQATLNAIDMAVRMGAKLIITPGHIFETAIYKAQDIYTNTHFILIDGEPQDGTYTDYKTAKNTIAILYAEEEAGFLAGYYQTQDYEYALKTGVAAGSASAFSVQLATKKDVDLLLKQL